MNAGPVSALCAAALALIAAAAAPGAPPRVVSAAPDHGDAAVDPALDAIRIEFDQDMSPAALSICGGGPSMPVMADKPRWESARVLILSVRLEPSHDYELSVNCPSAQNTRSATGEPAQICPLRFRTAADSGSAAPPVALTLEQNRAAISDLRTAIHDRYSYRDMLHIDWDARLEELGGAMEAAQTRAAFARIAAGLLAEARDVHVGVLVGEARFACFRAEPFRNFNRETLSRLVPDLTDRTSGVARGRFDDGVGYLLVEGWSQGSAGICLACLRDLAGAPALIIDVRPNGGGDESAARRVAACFIDKDAVYSRNSTRDPGAPDGWSPVFDRVVSPGSDTPRFDRPVAVLIGQGVMSSAESFVLMMDQCPNVTLVGDRTFGSSGNPRRYELANGVSVLLPSWQDMLPDGSPLEGRGIQPDVPVRTSASELAAGDPVLEAGLRIVREKPRPSP